MATKLDLEVGSDPLILPAVDEADAFLAAWPPGSAPAGAERQRAGELRDELEAYNEAPCPEDD